MTVLFDNLQGLLPFASLAYLVFLAVILLVYYSLPTATLRTMWLLIVSSLFFLLYSPSYLWVIGFVTACSFISGLMLERITDARFRKWILKVSVFGLLATLVVFKYMHLGTELAGGFYGVNNNGGTSLVFNVLLPVGISFWVLQAIAYVVDVFRDESPPITNLLTFASSIVFFPILVMGPITPIASLAPQLSKKQKFSPQNIQSGFLLIGWGFFKKLVIADRLAVFVNQVFENPYAYSGRVNGSIFLIAALFFAVQIYADFSGYTDIVRGSARTMGFTLPLNFEAPYFARSVSDFWRRWHMSLMAWLKKYIYIPLGGNRVGARWKYLNVMLTFAVSGLWHGVGLSYLAWGLLNGFYIVVGDMLASQKRNLQERFNIRNDTFAYRLFQTVAVIALITVAWVFFRANSLSQALYILPRMLIPTPWVLTDGSLLNQGLSQGEITIALVATVLVWCIDWKKRSDHTGIQTWFRTQPLWFRWALYFSLILSILLLGHFGLAYQASDFIYFQF